MGILFTTCQSSLSSDCIGWKQMLDKAQFQTVQTSKILYSVQLMLLMQERNVQKIYSICCHHDYGEISEEEKKKRKKKRKERRLVRKFYLFVCILQ